MQGLKKYLAVFRGEHFQLNNGFIVGSWSSIVQTHQFENKKNSETQGKIQFPPLPSTTICIG